MENTILDRTDVEELTEEELYDLYKIVITEVCNREKTKRIWWKSRVLKPKALNSDSKTSHNDKCENLKKH